MTRFSIRIQPHDRLTLRTDRGRQGETGPAGYAVPIEGHTFLANPTTANAAPVPVPTDAARSLLGAISEADMQAALSDSRADVLARTINPGIDGTEWNNDGNVQFSNGPVFILPSGEQIVSPTGAEYLADV